MRKHIRGDIVFFFKKTFSYRKTCCIIRANKTIEGGEYMNNGNKLTGKQRKYAEAYVQCWNKAEAARRAGYSTKSAADIGYQLSRDPAVKDYILKIGDVPAFEETIGKMRANRERLERIANGEGIETVLSYISKGVQGITEIPIPNKDRVKASAEVAKIDKELAMLTLEQRKVEASIRLEEDMRKKVIEETKMIAHNVSMVAGSEGLSEFQKALVEAVGGLATSEYKSVSKQ